MTITTVLALPRRLARLLQWRPRARHAIREQRGEAEADAYIAALRAGSTGDEWAHLRPAFEQVPGSAFRKAFSYPPWEEAPAPARVQETFVPDLPAGQAALPAVPPAVPPGELAPWVLAELTRQHDPDANLDSIVARVVSRDA